ncbi:MAG: hypothetical protein ACE5ID_04125 [Acidobacteriota bacterium]
MRKPGTPEPVEVRPACHGDEPSRSLLAATHGLIERTYGARSGVSDLAPFIIGDGGYRRFFLGDSVVGRLGGETAEEAPRVPAGPRVLVRDLPGGPTALAIYFPDALIKHLEEAPPTLGLDGDNVDDFASFVEEIDHFIVLAHGIRTGKSLNLLALETRANISKALVLFHFIGRLSGRTRLLREERLWTRHHLFEKVVFIEGDPLVRRRYEEARRLAVRLLDRLEQLPLSRRLKELRRWNQLSPQQMLLDLDSA